MKLLIFIVLILTILNNKLFVSTSSSTSTECVKSVKSVSEVNPYVNESPVIIQGTFCTNNVSDITVIFFVPYGPNYLISLFCDSNVTIDSTGSTITCKTNGIITQNVNFTLLSVVEIDTTQHINTSLPLFGIGGYLFTNSTCNCNGNGYCDIGMNCRCNEGYASFDCSYQVENKTVLQSPHSITNESFAMVTGNEQFNIRLSHVVANSLLLDEDFNFQIYLPNLQSTNITNSTDGYSFTKYGLTSPGPSWLTSLYYNVQYYSSVTPSFSYINYKGAYLPKSSQATLITIYPTINSTSGMYAFPVFNTSGTNASYSLIFEISSLKGIWDQEYGFDQSENGNSIALIEKNTQSLLVFTLSDIYSFNGTTVANHSNIEVADAFYSVNLIEQSNNNVYLIVTFGQTNNPIKTGNYTIQLIVNAYNLSVTKNGQHFPKWLIGLIIGGVVGVFIICGVVIFCIQRKKRKGYHHIKDHHHVQKSHH